MSRLLFVLLIVVMASATLAANVYADDKDDIEDKGTGYYRCTVLEDPAGVYYYNEKVLDSCVELKVKN